MLIRMVAPFSVRVLIGSDGYCLRCEKIAADVDTELVLGVEQQ